MSKTNSLPILKAFSSLKFFYQQITKINHAALSTSTTQMLLNQSFALRVLFIMKKKCNQTENMKHSQIGIEVQKKSKSGFDFEA